MQMLFYTRKNSPVIKKSRNTRGFSLVEMIVSMAIFSVVAVIALGALTKIIASNRKAQSLQSSITNLNFMLDSMSRELRVGAYYQCDTISPTNSNYKGEDFQDTTQCSDPSTRSVSSGDGIPVAIAFKTARVAIDGVGNTCALATAYRFIEINGVWHLEKAIQKDCTNGIVDGNFMDVVDPNVTITDWYLRVATEHKNNGGTLVANDEFPLVTIGISGYSGIRERDKTYFSVQTAVSPRINNF